MTNHVSSYSWTPTPVPQIPNFPYSPETFTLQHLVPSALLSLYIGNISLSYKYACFFFPKVHIILWLQYNLYFPFSLKPFHFHTSHSLTHCNLASTTHENALWNDFLPDKSKELFLVIIPVVTQ